MQRLLRPDLPSRVELYPYLARIDATGWASNDGPLVRELEARLGGVCVSSGTLGLMLAVTAMFDGDTEIRVPALTFPATVHAACLAGNVVRICDVDEETWAIAPEENTLAVCPFGYPAYGPLIDAAGAWGIQREGVRVHSLHATKPLPAGEGGVVIGPESLLDEIRATRNFGIVDGLCVTYGTNAKMSEYHAAVALASLDRYERVAARRREVADRYHANLAHYVGLRPYHGGTMFPVLVDDAADVVTRLGAAGYEARQGYGPTMDMLPAFEELPRDRITVAHELARRIVCLPFHNFLTDMEIDHISSVVVEKRAAA